MRRAKNARNVKQDSTNSLCKTTIQMEIRKRVTRLVAQYLKKKRIVSSFLNY